MMIEKSHQLISTLGIGGAGEVYSVRNINDNTIMAAKYARNDLKISHQKRLMLMKREKDIMEDLHDHPNVLKSYNFFTKREAVDQCDELKVGDHGFDSRLATSPFHMIEYCENGSFITYLRNQDELSEDVATYYVEQLLNCLEYVHYKNYAHLDVKLDNILLDDNFNIRISDFGSAVKLEDDPFTMFRRGTPKYMAPEVLNLQNGESFDAFKADVYSMGVCIYLMLFKRFPVHEATEYPTTKDLLEDPEVCKIWPFDCDKSRWGALSPEIQRILIAWLNVDSVDRPSTNELIGYFYLPALGENVADKVFEQMQDRRAVYEQVQQEKQFQNLDLVQAELPEELPWHEDKSKSCSMSHEQCDKSGASTYANTSSQN